MSSPRKELIFCVLFFALAGSAWLASEIRWGTINNPVGKFETASEYLAAGRLPSRVTTLVTNDRTFYIGRAPMDTWLAIPSGSPAYVFDDSGKLVRWYLNSSDTRKFESDWPLQQQRKATLEDLRKPPVPKLSETSKRQPTSTVAPKQ
jgi:hypothetical protein